MGQRFPLPPHTLIMVIDADLADLIELLQFPFITGAPGYCWAYWAGCWEASRLRQLSFSHTVGHAALLGLFWGYLNLDPTLTLLPFTVLFAGCGLLYPDRLGDT